jgi:hypothetical protein
MPLMLFLERAVPAIEDGFKPVQRRIMHTLKLDDGRYNKVASLVTLCSIILTVMLVSVMLWCK